jgi:hypothetical protein
MEYSEFLSIHSFYNALVGIKDLHIRVLAAFMGA